MKFSRKLFFLSAVCCLLAATLSGCSSISDNRATTNPNLLEPQAILKFNDIPVPVGLKSLPAQSYSFQSSGVRVGVLKYQGKNNPDQVVNFYKEQMPMFNWNLVNIVEYGQRLLNFERENETCIITLEQRGSTVILTISLGPKSQSVPKKSKSPVK